MSTKGLNRIYLEQKNTHKNFERNTFQIMSQKNEKHEKRDRIFQPKINLENVWFTSLLCVDGFKWVNYNDDEWKKKLLKYYLICSASTVRNCHNCMKYLFYSK